MTSRPLFSPHNKGVSGCRADSGSHWRGTSDPTPSAEPVQPETPLAQRNSGPRAKSTPDLEVQLMARMGSSRYKEAASPAGSFSAVLRPGQVRVQALRTCCMLI